MARNLFLAVIFFVHSAQGEVAISFRGLPYLVKVESVNAHESKPNDTQQFVDVCYRISTTHLLFNHAKFASDICGEYHSPLSRLQGIAI